MNLDISYYVSVFLRRIYIMVIVAVGLTAAATYVALQLPADVPRRTRGCLSNRRRFPRISRVRRCRWPRRSSCRSSAAPADARQSAAIARQIERLPADRADDLRTRSSRRCAAARGSTSRIGGPRQPSSTSASPVRIRTRPRRSSTSTSRAFSRRTGRSAPTSPNRRMDFFEQETQRLSGELGRRSEEIVSFKRQNADALPQSLRSARTDDLRCRSG